MYVHTHTQTHTHINDLICIKTYSSLYVCTYRGPNPRCSNVTEQDSRLRPKLRKSSQHCHFSACFSYFSSFSMEIYQEITLTLSGDRVRANLTRSQAQQHKQQGRAGQRPWLPWGLSVTEDGLSP